MNILGDISPFNVIVKPSIIEKPLSRCKCGSTDHKKTSHRLCQIFKDKTTVNTLVAVDENMMDDAYLAIDNIDRVNNILQNLKNNLRYPQF